MSDHNSFCIYPWIHMQLKPSGQAKPCCRFDHSKYRDEHGYRIRNFGKNIINYMNSEDKHKNWNKFLDYSKTLDDYHGTNLYDVFPEYNF